MTFDEALAALLALVGERVEVHVMDAGGDLRSRLAAGLAEQDYLTSVGPVFTPVQGGYAKR